MEILSIQEVYTEKFKRQRQIKALQYHADGVCVHIGKISPGCEPCFVPNLDLNISCGAKCNVNCPYCTSDKKDTSQNKTSFQEVKANILRRSRLSYFGIQRASFSGGGEPLFYLDEIAKYMRFFHRMERYMKNKPWYYLYTNGTLANTDALIRLRDLGFDEIRFHLGASNFSKGVYKNVANAKRYLKAVTVETPAWSLHRKRLFQMLPIIDDIGINHLNIGEVEIHNFNYDRIARLLPKAKIYYCYEVHLYDDGLVYDIMEEVLRRGYNYSVLDCNCFVKCMQRSRAKLICEPDVKGLFARYKG